MRLRGKKHPTPPDPEILGYFERLGFPISSMEPQPNVGDGDGNNAGGTIHWVLETGPDFDGHPFPGYGRDLAEIWDYWTRWLMFDVLRRHARLAAITTAHAKGDAACRSQIWQWLTNQDWCPVAFDTRWETEPEQDKIPIGERLDVAVAARPPYICVLDNLQSVTELKRAAQLRLVELNRRDLGDALPLARPAPTVSRL